MDDKNRVLEVKSKLNALSTKKSRLEGQFDAVKKTMVDKYGIPDIDTFIKERDKLCTKRDMLQVEINTLLTKAENLLDGM